MPDYLKIIGQLRSPSITWVHGDEDTASRVQFDVGPFKEESVRARVDACYI